jgi:serine/threonine kinase 38
VNGVGEIKIHPFFNGIDWKNIGLKNAPFKPLIKHEYDTSNFDKFDD